MASIEIKTLGLKGVNTDKDPLALDPDELTEAQNAITEPLGKLTGIVNRPGLVEFTTDIDDASGDAVLGGIGVLEPNGNNGLQTLYLGRGGAA